MKLHFKELTEMIDLSVVQAQNNEEDVKAVVKMAIQYQCNAVFTLPSHTPFLRQLLANERKVAIGGVVGFPSGGVTMRTKIAETKELIGM